MVKLRSGLQTFPVGEIRRVGEDLDAASSTSNDAPMEVSVDELKEFTPPSSLEPPIPPTDARNEQNPVSADLAMSFVDPECDDEWTCVAPSWRSGVIRCTPSPSPTISSTTSVNRYEVLLCAPGDAALGEPVAGSVAGSVAVAGSGSRVGEPAPSGGPDVAAHVPTNLVAGGAFPTPPPLSSPSPAVTVCTVPGCRLPRGLHRNGFSVRGYRLHMSTMHGRHMRRVSEAGTPRVGVHRIVRTSTEDPTEWLAGQALDPDSWDWLGQSLGLCRTDVPGRSQRLWAEAVGFYAHLCSNENGQAGAWWALLALPRLCLPIKNAEGFKLRPKAYNANFLLSLAIQGKFQELMDLAVWRAEQVPSDRAPCVRASALVRASVDVAASAEIIPERNVRRANLMMRRGRPSKALTSLTGGGGVQVTEGVLQRLRDLHPSSGAITPSERTQLFTSITDSQVFNTGFTQDLARKVLGGAPKMSAPGGSGWTFEMLTPLTHPHSDGHWASLVSALGGIASGRVPPEVGTFLRTSRLVPIPKVSSDPEAVRPVAVGEIFPRFVGRCLARKFQSKFSDYFSPIQFGVATPAGTDMCLKTIFSHFAFLDQKGTVDTVILGMDAINAFNSASRGQALVRLAQSDFSDLLPMISLLYGEVGYLKIFEGKHPRATLESVSGVRQGDPFGSFLFALLIHDDLLELHLKFIEKGVLMVAYLDDIFIVGDRALALEAANELASKLALKNLSFGKNKLFSPNPEFACDDASLVLPGLTFFEDECPKFLGAFFGRNATEKIENYVTEKIAGKCSALVEYARQGNAFTALQLLLVCVGNIPNYFLRMMPPNVTAPMAAAADRILIDTFLSISGLSDIHDRATFDADGLPGCVLRLPQREGGFGLPSQTTLCKSAYYASWKTVGRSIRERFPHLRQTVSNWLQGTCLDGTCSALVREIADGLSQQRTYISETLQLPETLIDIDNDDEPTQPRVTAREAPLQQIFSTEEGRRVTQVLRVKVDELHEPLTKAWFHGLGGYGRASYLHAPPSRGVKPLTNVEFEFAIRRHFRIPLRGPHLQRKCSCGDPLDPHGDHVDTCRHLVEMRTLRHDNVNLKGLIEPAKQVKLKPRREPLGLVEGTRGRPADTLIESSLGLRGAENTWLCFDVVGCASFSEAHARVAARHPGGAMIQAMGRKIRQAIHLRASCHDLTVIPMPFESQGVLHEHWAEIYHLFARHWVQHNNRTKREASALVRIWTAQTSLTIQRAQYSLYQRMLQNLMVARNDDIPHSLRQPDEGVVALASACLPVLERGGAFGPLTQT